MGLCTTALIASKLCVCVCFLSMCTNTVRRSGCICFSACSAEKQMHTGKCILGCILGKSGQFPRAPKVQDELSWYPSQHQPDGARLLLTTTHFFQKILSKTTSYSCSLYSPNAELPFSSAFDE